MIVRYALGFTFFGGQTDGKILTVATDCYAIQMLERHSEIVIQRGRAEISLVLTAEALSQGCSQCQHHQHVAANRASAAGDHSRLRAGDHGRLRAGAAEADVIGAGGRVTEDGQGSARAAGGGGREAEIDRAAGTGGQHSPAIIGAGKGRRGADAGDRQWHGAAVGEGDAAAAAVADGDIAEADAVAAQHHGTRHGNLDLHRRRQIRDRVLRGRGPGEGD